MERKKDEKHELFLEYRRLFIHQLESQEERIKELEDRMDGFTRFKERVVTIGIIVWAALTTGVTVLVNYLLKK